MKNKIYNIYILIVIILFAVSGCVKDNKASSTALFGLHLHTYIADTLVSPALLRVWYPDSAGRVEQLTHAQFYMTNISLHSTTTNSWYVIPNSILLKREEYEEYILANIPADNYDDVRFTVGLSAALNSAAPSSYPTTGPDSVLSTLENFMWFGVNEGYKFISVAGMVDTTANNSGTNVIPFSYDIGATGDTLNITMPQQAFTIVPGSSVYNQVQLVHIVCDYGHMLQNIPIVTTPGARNYSSNGATPAPGSTGAQIWTNMMNMFRYECSTPNGDC